jgi:hypothetical protein
MRHELPYSSIWSWGIEVRRDTLDYEEHTIGLCLELIIRHLREPKSIANLVVLREDQERRTWKGLKGLRDSDTVLLLAACWQ